MSDARERAVARVRVDAFAMIARIKVGEVS
jgi:hypothetical protein